MKLDHQVTSHQRSIAAPLSNPLKRCPEFAHWSGSLFATLIGQTELKGKWYWVGTRHPNPT